MSFAPGQAVRVRDAWPELNGPVHIRAPHYVRGVAGTVERRLGDFPNPEDLAFDRPAALRALYHVRFALADIWPEHTGDDGLLVEIYDHWLETP
jgi:hypothetical protein